jgi:methionyl-tRNA synthetase
MFCLCAAATNMVCHFDESQKKVTPQVIDKYDGIIRKSFLTLISFDNYSRTSAKIHHDTASEFFTTLYEKVIL